MILTCRLLVFSAFISCLISQKAVAQVPVQCPPNIGFEQGNFNNWNLSYGMILQTGVLDINFQGQGSHAIFARANALRDPFGDFPLECPNGSGYSIRIGDQEVGAKAERASYTFTIPAGQDVYSIIYHYAVVLQNPNHAPYQQPSFTTQVFNVTDNQYVSCPSFQFVASSSLPGFLLSPIGTDVYYKPWAAVTLNLTGLGGKTLRLDFTSNDCSQGGHFGYAYLDIDEDCASPVKGNIFCGNPASITLKAPYGFAEYRWWSAGFTQQLGTGQTLTLSPPPPHGTVFAVEIIPYPGLGCRDTLYTTATALPDPLVLNVTDTVIGCDNPGVNIMNPAITAGSTPGLVYHYYLDLVGTMLIPQPDKIKTAGYYYINATNTVGCTVTKPVYIDVSGKPNVMIADTVSGCSPPGVNLTLPSVSAGSPPGLTYTYWKDDAATIPLPNPNAVDVDGVYYIKGTNPNGCTATEPVLVKSAKMDIKDQSACGFVNLRQAVNVFSAPGFNYSYWTNASMTDPLVNPDSIITTGSYYVKGSHTSGCELIKNVQVVVTPYPDFTITDPPAVNYPATINLPGTVNAALSYNFTYWKDPACTQPAFRPEAIVAAGIYYIKASTANGCSVTKPVNIIVIPPPKPKVIAVTAFTPNGDGINDVFRITVEGVIRLNNISIYNRWGQPVFWSKDINQPWDGKVNGKPLPMGTYYWTFDGMDSYRQQKVLQTGPITIIR